MSVIRVNKSRDYTVMSNYHFRDKNLSLKAKGLLSQMLSLPEGWDYTIAGLAAINKENETAIKSALGELKEHGYLIVTKKLPHETDSGRIEYVYDIYEQPTDKQATEKQGTENQAVVFQSVENQGQYNTDKSITKKSNTNNTDRNNNIAAVVAYLNEKAGTSYRASSKATARHIEARLNEGYKLQDFYSVIDKKVAEWKGGEMEKYLRPETLFGSKFEGYLNARVTANNRRGANGVLMDDRTADELDAIF